MFSSERLSDEIIVRIYLFLTLRTNTCIDGLAFSDSQPIGRCREKLKKPFTKRKNRTNYLHL